MARGLRIDYCPDLCIHHPNPLQTQDECLQERNLKYSRGRGYLLRKHQFPVLQIVKSMVRTLGGSLLMAATARPCLRVRHHRSAYPSVKARARPGGGSLLRAATARPFWARYYWRSFVGKWQGLRGGKAAPEQLLTSPLVQESRQRVAK